MAESQLSTILKIKILARLYGLLDTPYRHFTTEFVQTEPEGDYETVLTCVVEDHRVLVTAPSRVLPHLHIYCTPRHP